jgi:hypothetical protein
MREKTASHKNQLLGGEASSSRDNMIVRMGALTLKVGHLERVISNEGKASRRIWNTNSRRYFIIKQ